MQAAEARQSAEIVRTPADVSLCCKTEGGQPGFLMNYRNGFSTSTSILMKSRIYLVR